ncbi:glycosyltransferase family protein [Pseudodesulfovibrio sp.]|uniref:glycosyltransferase family protein n=1 Tax=unclassified Pseudodesulfovibrio TaxID=2661612 RepID=UPI003AFF764F
MPEITNVCLIDAPLPLVRGFEKLGCAVLNLGDGPGQFLSLPETLEAEGFRPDMVLQVESLGRRRLITGLDRVECPTLLWCVDPHLNAHWHSAWARLFDLTCSTQGHWLPELRTRGARDVRWLPWFGLESAWKEPSERTTDVAFVGRITEQRSARRWLTELLAKKTSGFNLAIRQDLNYAAMLDLYRDSRIIPNESICGEINFRLFEGASCGCLVLGQTVEGQAELFEPGREMDTCAHAVELEQKLDFYLRNPRLTAAMGRAAYERVRAEHLPEHRAAQLLKFAAEATDLRARGRTADTGTALTASAMWEADLLEVPAAEIFTLLEKAEPVSEVAEAAVRLEMLAGMLPAAESTATAWLAGHTFEDSASLNLTGSMTGLRLDNFDMAKAFWYRHCKSSGGREATPPKDETALLTLWAKDLNRSRITLRSGFPFDPKRHLPASASECLLTILDKKPEHLPTLRLLDTMLRPFHGVEQSRVGLLSVLTLHEREDWRLAFEIALADLKSFRLESGLEELRLSRNIAQAVGQEAHFLRALKARDDSGLLVSRLE